MKLRLSLTALISVTILTLLSACGGGGGGTTTTAVNASALTTDYRVEYIPAAGGDVVAKDTFTLKITKRSDSTPYTGPAANIVLTPTMIMSGMPTIGTWPQAVVATNVPGTYTGTLYYSMKTDEATNMTWTLGVTVDNEPTATLFTPNVAGLPTATDTISAKLSSNSDMVGASARTYRIWRDSIAATGAGVYDFTVFVSSADAGKTLPVYTGEQWTTPAMSLTTVVLQASTDGTNWTPLNPVADSLGRYKASGLSLTAGTAGKVYIKLTINGNDYTTNGLVADGSSNVSSTNAFAALTVTP